MLGSVSFSLPLQLKSELASSDPEGRVSLALCCCVVVQKSKCAVVSLEGVGASRIVFENVQLHMGYVIFFTNDLSSSKATR